MAIAFTNAPSGAYIGFAAGAYACIGVIFMFVLVFGLRARRNVKHEKVTSLPDGFSPLDVKRIFIGKTYPRRLTRALITYWAERGYIKVKQLTRNTVRIVRRTWMPNHDNDRAVFFDRGTYVREHDLFKIFMRKVGDGTPVNLNRPLFDRHECDLSGKYAVREDDGVYSAAHYSLKIFTIALCIVTALLAQMASGFNGGEFMGIVGVGTALIGLFVLMFVKDMPIVFKAIWCGGWLAGSTAFMFAGFTWASDPFGLVLTSVVLLYLGPLFIIRFVDYREKNNLDDYSDLVNYRKFLLFAPAAELRSLDYYKILPLLYAFRIKTIVKHKIGEVPPPDWYENESGAKGGLL